MTNETLITPKWAQEIKIYFYERRSKTCDLQELYAVLKYNSSPSKIRVRNWSIKMLKLTSLLKAAEAVWRSAGSIARRVSTKGNDDGGKSLNVSCMHRLYGCCGLNIVAWGNFDFFQYSSEGEPHNLKILCSCSTWKWYKLCYSYQRRNHW